METNNEVGQWSIILGFNNLKPALPIWYLCNVQKTQESHCQIELVTAIKTEKFVLGQ